MGRIRRAIAVAVAVVAGAGAASATAAADTLKVVATDRDAAAEQDLRARGAVQRAIDYGSFRLLFVDSDAAGGRAAVASRGLTVRDDMNVVQLERYALDTRRPAATEGQLRGWQKRDELARAKAERRAPRDGLYLVQFAGPVRPSWVKGLEDAGLELVSYLPENAYAVRAQGAATKRLDNLRSDENVQFVGDFHPAYRLTDGLRAAADQGGEGTVDVVVQVVDGSGAGADLADLRKLASAWVQEHRVGTFRNAELSIARSRLAELAGKEYVFHAEERTQRQRLDEAQGQILAGNLLGNVPSGPGYASWLSTKGFTSSQFGSFAVNVADDAYTLSGHPDLPSARIAFQNNPTSQTGALGGHGFLNANIVAGFNGSTGSAYEDANGYNYGLGVAPYARVGATAIFGNGSSSPSAWENTAYGQGARISTNSWGYTGTAARRYDSAAQEYDRIVRDAQSGVAGQQQLSVVFAAGNDGSGSNTVSSPGTAKNVITAGAGENVRQTGTDGCSIANTGADSANDVISFSSRGPVNSAGGDGRTKPDIMAPGTHIEAGVPQSNYDGSSVCDKYWPAGQTLYGWSSGTSHSTPAVAGGAALVYQDFLNHGRPTPSPAMVKAYLENSAQHMTGTGANDTLPSNNQGMGRMHLGRAFDGVSRVLVDQSQLLSATGQTYSTSGSVAGSGPFRVTLAWTDAPGPTTGAPWVNNLDLEVTVGGTTYKGNVFSGASSISGGTADTRNNVESVFLPSASGSYTVTVRGTNIAGDGVPGNGDATDQDFALVIDNAGAPTSQPTIATSPSSLSFSGVAGGSNPAAKTLSISNSGGGTLTWTASDNASWLSLSPTSGTAPSSATVSVSTAGLAAGTYNGAITISATGATNTPVTVPVTLTVTQPSSAELIANGGFEGSSSPWALSGDAYWSTGGYAHSGTGYSILGYYNYASGSEYQAISIPSTASSANLNFWLNVTSSESTTTTQYDRMYVEVRNTSGSLLQTLATFSNLNKGTAGVYSLRGPYSLLAYRGQTVRVQFRATTDYSLPTAFRVDDVSVK